MDPVIYEGAKKEIKKAKIDDGEDEENSKSKAQDSKEQNTENTDKN